MQDPQHLLQGQLLRSWRCAEGVNCGLDFKKALKDSESERLVKFQGSPQVRSCVALAVSVTASLQEFPLGQVIQLQRSCTCDG